MTRTKPRLRDNEERALFFHYVLVNGLPPWNFEYGAAAQIKVFAKISGLSEEEAATAFAGLEDKGLINRRESHGGKR